MPLAAFNSEVFPELHNWRLGLSKAATQDLELRLKFKTLRHGEALFLHGENAGCGYQIVSGKIEIRSYTSAGQEMLLATMSPTDCIGDSGMINRGIRLNNAVAVGETTVNFLLSNDYQALCNEHPEVSHCMNRMLARRFEFMYSLVQDASLLPLVGRIGRALIRLAIVNKPTDSSGEIRITNYSQEKLSQMVGATRSRVNREMLKLQQAGLIRNEYRSVYVTDFDGLVEKFGDV